METSLVNNIFILRSGTGCDEMTLFCDLMNIHFSDGISFSID